MISVKHNKIFLAVQKYLSHHCFAFQQSPLTLCLFIRNTCALRTISMSRVNVNVSLPTSCQCFFLKYLEIHLIKPLQVCKQKHFAPILNSFCKFQKCSSPGSPFLRPDNYFVYENQSKNGWQMIVCWQQAWFIFGKTKVIISKRFHLWVKILSTFMFTRLPDIFCHESALTF